MTRLFLALAFILGTSAAVSAQVVQTPHGTVEFIGLQRWTIPMIQDTMAVHAPGRPLGQCAEVLKQLGFVSASALSIEGADGKIRTVVTVVEPHRASRVRLRVPAGDSLPDAAEWTRGIKLFAGHNGAFQSAIQLRGLALQQDTATLAQLLPL